MWLRKCVLNVIVAVGFHVVVLCFCFTLIKWGFEICFPAVIFGQITHTLVVCVVGAGLGKHGALKVVQWLFEVN